MDGREGRLGFGGPRSRATRQQRHSQIALKTYARGREPWQGESCDVVALDEEPPLDIYLEALTRTNATGGITAMVFTPLLGMSEVVRRFYLWSHPDRASVRMTIVYAEHLDEEQRLRILASYGPADIEARAQGLPRMGNGRVFPIAEADIVLKAFQVQALAADRRPRFRMGSPDSGGAPGAGAMLETGSRSRFAEIPPTKNQLHGRAGAAGLALVVRKLHVRAVTVKGFGDFSDRPIDYGRVGSDVASPAPAAFASALLLPAVGALEGC